MKQLDMEKLQPIFTLKSTVLERLEAAYVFANKHTELNQAVFPYQEFSISLKDLFEVALGKSTISHCAKIERCFEHMLFHKYENETYWAYQNFSFTLFELLEQCMRQVKPQAILEIKQDMRNFHKDYQSLMGIRIIVWKIKT